MITTAVASQTPVHSEASDMIPEKVPGDNVDHRFIKISIEKVIRLHEAGYTDQAVAAYADLLDLYPENDEIMFKLARLHQCAGREELAIAILNGITRHSPYFADALYSLGVMLGNKRDFAGGADCLTQLLELDNSRIECYNNLARFMVELGRPEEAQRYLLTSLQVSPDEAETHNYLGNLYVSHWRFVEADNQYRRAIELSPKNASAYCNLAWIATLENRITDAVALYFKALEFAPSFRIAADNLLFTLNYSDIFTPEQVRDEHLRLADLYTCPGAVLPPRHHQQGNKLRVGYVSADFKTHSVGFFFEKVLFSHNCADFEIFCYDLVPVPDETTRRMMSFVYEWRTVYGLSDSAIADLIQVDCIDILVDLSGHTKGNRLGVFTFCPAPIQVTWLGYPNTTGLKHINYRLTDELADPSGITDHLYIERLVRLPRSFLCYAPPILSIEVAPLPEGAIIFCCFNNYPKISDTVLQLWCRVLHTLPGSLLSIKNGSLHNTGVHDRLVNRFAAHGIDRSRLTLCSHSESREEHLRRYGACHIALDTFPYNGTTTTCEALWMGVPVVTLAGVSHASRVGVSILKNVGVPEMIAANADQYVEIAVGLALKPERLRQYRNSLREKITCSPLMDASGFTKDLEQAYRWMLEQHNT